MKGFSLLNDQIGRKLTDGRIQSFELKGELIDLINVTFLKFDNWVKIVSSEEETDISLENDEFGNISKYGDGEFIYPITKITKSFPEFNKYLGLRLIGFKELVWDENNDFSFGINLYFENELNFIIHNQVNPIEKNEFIFDNKVPNDLIEI